MPDSAQGATWLDEAVEAAAKSWDEAAWDPESCMPVTMGAPTQGLARHAAQEDAKSDARIILTAAMPTAREGIAQEIENLQGAWFLGLYAEGYNQAIEDAAAVARGVQR